MTGLLLARTPSGDRRGALAKRRAVRTVRRVTLAGRSLPDFLIIGAMKAGTTSLHAHLTAFPDVRSGVEKEIHYFDHHSARGESWYRSSFPRSRPGVLVGESSPYYLLHPLAPARVAALVPRVRLVAVLRDPVSRAYSHFQHSRALGVEPEADFETALRLEHQRTDAGWERLRRGSTREPSVEHFSYIRRGRYSEQIERWHAALPSEALLLITTDELERDPYDTVSRVRTHLGLETTPAGRPGTPDFTRLNARVYPRLGRGARDYLATQLADEVERTEDLLGRPTGWSQLRS